MSSSYDLENKPTAQEAIKRLSTGASLNESSTNLAATPKDDKSLKIATFSLQGYLKVKRLTSFVFNELMNVIIIRKKSLLQSF